ncbi:Roadblock/LC7 domain containing protein, putative [Trypanosoma equiperdum]|uniref:Dynein light chain roadblock n=4 Tax=Trypanozoon TaxID=39700 RepID=Q381D2_TRYB2|nr:hypothetical protein, conserved [Trypanosoma brucei gambiense DAL972]XP_829711.1 hypothetical protein, conserved [Trypanosoma brucei brucei TREU927]RHW68247.1 Roadblock/LC7 domain containing protein [Trypanosoma brucei equiperdum]SCU67325.1 Roadblock/LC7 domain containing protein, putative [Trypanosoma equiperdum]EAN80599.1 hypothetical protein, conserved [Trypanosoma brucei brucei TREU927]CBH18739.1 hypothetical protein, conserved [Trypanosoma brucei gambiense DAL972]|eukprot:XP_011781003.1 hypothetical protein, conserved [Trypanosoma brucei gambiense DAL972]
MTSERVESVLELITYTKGVAGAVVCNRNGEPIRDSFQDLDRNRAVAYSNMAADLARDAALLFSADESLDAVRVRSLNNEIIIKCHEEFLLVVIQELTK